jgi:manganese-dependent inorganic pyrophosphatase
MDEMAKELFANTASIKDKEFKDILYNDTKPYDLNGFHIQVSQVFVFDFHDIDNIKEQFEYYMQEQIKNTNLDLWLMVFTNVEGEGSKILHVGRLSHQLDDAIAQFEAKGYVSRKKEIVPGIAKALA